MPYVITDKCELNLECIDVCPSESISVPEGSTKAVIDPETCTDCGECAEACPVGAPVPGEELEAEAS